MLNEEISKFKQGDDQAFSNIIDIVRSDMYKIIGKYQIPGLEKSDMFSLAMEAVLDCLKERELARGHGIKKVLSENDPEIKNRNFIKAAINYKLIRELRSKKGNIRISYDIPFLQENGDTYKDRKGKPLYVGVIFHSGTPYLIEDKKNTKVIINVSKDDIHRNETTFEYNNPIDSSISFDATIDDDDNEHEIRNVLEFESANKFYLSQSNGLDTNIMISIISNKPMKMIQKRTIKMLLKKSKGDVKDLKEFVNKCPQRVKKVEHYLRSILL